MYTFIDKITGQIITDELIIEYYTMIAQTKEIPSGTTLYVKCF